MDALFSYILEELELPNGSGRSVSHDVIYNTCLVRTSGKSHGVCSQEPSEGPAPLCLFALICSPRLCFIKHVCSLLPSSSHLRCLMNQRLSQQFRKAPNSHTASTEMEVISLIVTGIVMVASIGCQSLILIWIALFYSEHLRSLIPEKVVTFSLFNSSLSFKLASSYPEQLV